MSNNFSSLVTEALIFLNEQQVSSSKFEIYLLLSDILGIEPSEIRTYSSFLTEDQNKVFHQMLEKRAAHWPVDKIIGHKGFYKYEFRVTKDVLSPRAETEILVEKALDQLKTISSPKIFEFGIGSGCILLSLLADRPDAVGFGLEISKEALQVALHNAQSLGVLSRCKLFCGSWFDEQWLREQNFTEMDLIVSNPPYITTKEIETLAPEVKNFDPITALDGGRDGLKDYHQIFKLASEMLKKDGIIEVEIGENQEESVCSIAEKNHFKLLEIVKDLNHTNRCIILKK